MKRYLAFGGYLFYPSGGWGDFKGDYDSPEEAKKRGQDWCDLFPDVDCWWDVVDRDSGRYTDSGKRKGKTEL